MRKQRAAHNLAQFVQWVTDNPLPDLHPYLSRTLGHSVFFRGHANTSYKLEPSVYRDFGFREFERLIYLDMLRATPDEFKNTDTKFENLVKMQHHGAPTRLLDITLNSLTALFFACDGEDSVDGQVFRFNVPEGLCYFQSELPQSSLYFSPPGFSWQRIFLDLRWAIYHELSVLVGDLVKDANDFPDQDRHHLADLEKNYVEFKFAVNDPRFDHLSAQVKILEKSLRRLIPKYTFTEEIMLPESRSKLSEALGIEFEANAQLSSCLLDLGLPRFVYAPLNSERIRRQQGAFIVFPAAPFGKNPLEDLGKTTIQISSLLIPAHRKQKILKQLNSAGINRHFLFPEMAEHAAYVRKKYSNPQNYPDYLSDIIDSAE